jgi:hypothetical protein
MKKKKTDSATRDPLERPRKRYSAPHLVYYGDVTQLTRGGGGTNGDGGGSMSMIACWIAEVLYGVDAPRTRLVRGWLTESYKRRDFIGRIVVPLYSRFGVAVAGLLRRRPVLQGAFRPLFDGAVKRAHQEYAGRAVLLQS